MTKTELIELVSDSYPDGFISTIWNPETNTVISEAGDTLAEFIAREAAGAVDDYPDTEDQIARLDSMLETAMADLQGIRDGLSEFITEYTRSAE